jgi:Glycosyltransferases involved in cell wall biogenesis
MRVLVIIPAYNETESIKGVVAELKAAQPDYDYVVVNDCSTDDTEAVLKENGFNYINLPVNLGIGGGVQTGYKYAVEHGYDIAIQMDGDGQHDPAYLGTLVEPVAAGELDMSVGSRFVDKKGFQTSFMRRVGINFLCGLIRLLCGVKMSDATSGFRACGRDVIQLFSENYAQDYPEPEAIIAAVTAGYRVGEVAVEMRERQGGTSSISPFKSVYYMIKVSISIVLNRFMTKKRKTK